MNNKLVLHPSAHASAAAQIQVSANAKISQTNLILNYKVESKQGAPKVRWPLPTVATSKLDQDRRRDELWKTTCLEAFLMFLDGSYFELNFSPEGLWNAYRLDSYRSGMKAVEQIPVVTNFKSSKSEKADLSIYELSATIDLAQAVKSPQHFRLGLTSVIETLDGEPSYWSLKHSGEKPDFHDSRGYILEMRI